MCNEESNDYDSDCLVTIDNAVVHFAGALGVDTSLLIIDDLTWRWGTNFKRSDLYPSVEIVRS